MSEKLILGGADYAIFGVMLAIYAGTGLYFRMLGGKQKTNEEYLLAGKDMPIFPVSFSLMATYMSAITLVGVSADVYLFGTSMVFVIVGYMIGPLITSAVFLPIYFKTGVSTSYEYLEKRFGTTTRRVLSGLFLLQYILYNGAILYAPALALSAVTNLSVWASVISIGTVCTFYCTLGGMKAILWTDVFQSFLMYTCLLAIAIKGCMDLGGIKNIFKSARDGGRVFMPTFEMDFSTRYTMWSVLLQSLVITVQNFGGNQIQVQRQLTLRNLKRSTIASLISGPMVTAFHLLSCFCGLIFYVYFKSCDPMTSPDKPIQSADQLMPYYITSAMGQYPGLPGLCIAGIFSASLSSLSSAVNSMAAVTYEDIIRPIWPNLSGSVLVTKIASVIFGALSILVTYFVASMGNLVKASILIMGMLSGPSLGVFLLAALTTTANEMGANLGVLAGFVLAGCLAFIPNKRYPQLPVGRNCSEISVSMLNFTAPLDAANLSMNSTDPMIAVPAEGTSLPEDFPVSFMWISTLSLLVSVVVGLFGSWITTYIRGTSETVPSELLSPVRQWFSKDKQEKDVKKSDTYDDSKNVTTSRF